MTDTQFAHPDVSAIIPIYNAEATLERCLLSLINQSQKNLEIICVDDCSNDMSKEIVLAYQKKYPNQIKYLCTGVRQGPGGARNYGLAVASGLYIGFVDSDDWLDSSLYTIVFNAALEENADIAVFGVKNEYESFTPGNIRYQYRTENLIEHTYALQLLSRVYDNDVFISPMVCQKIYKHEFLTSQCLQFQKNSFFEDDLFSFQCFLHECTTIVVPGVFYHYYQRRNSITHSFSRKHIEDLVKLIVDLRAIIQEKGLWKTYKGEYYSFCNGRIRSTLNMLFSAEQRISIQKQYLTILFRELQANLPIDDWINYMDIGKIKQVLLDS